VSKLKTYERVVATEVADLDWAEVAPADPVEAAVLASPPMQLVEEPAWMTV